MPPISRVQRGVPTGGQFAADQHAESDVELDGVDEMKPWRDVGFTDAQATRWSERGFDADQASDWSSQVFSPDEAREWRDLGVEDPAVARRWTYAGPGTTTPERTRPWVEAGFGADGIDEADGWASYGFEANDAGLWRAAGFEHHEAAVWSKAGYEPGDSIGLRAEGFDPSKLSPTLHRTGETAFKIGTGSQGGGATYTMRAVHSAVAYDHGCPGATHAMVGQHETRFGRLEPVTGRRTRVPGWTKERKGVMADFVCDQDPDFEPLRGYLGE